MMQTQRRTFRNIQGHAKNVSDLSSLGAWTAEQFDPKLSWDDVEWVKKLWGGKLIIKGILDVEDAKMAAETGADAIVVSNHGGRQLDGSRAPFDQLAEIVDAVGDRIYVEGNNAAALGAVYGGATVCAWYPITPSTSLAEAFTAYCQDLRVEPETGKARYAIIQGE
eukprot:gene40715-55050_t